jgi:hypothetical protein
MCDDLESLTLIFYFFSHFSMMSSENVVTSYQTARCHSTEEKYRNYYHHHEILKCHTHFITNLLKRHFNISQPVSRLHTVVCGLRIVF